MKLYLTPTEKKNLRENKDIEGYTERKYYLPAAVGSILHGIGTGRLFDKIGYYWVYGDIQNYVNKMNKVDRRAEYQRSMEPTVDVYNLKYNSTQYWFDCVGTDNEWGNTGDYVTNGRVNKLNFKITNVFISELRQGKGKYKDIIFKIYIKYCSEEKRISK